MQGQLSGTLGLSGSLIYGGSLTGTLADVGSLTGVLSNVFSLTGELAAVQGLTGTLSFVAGDYPIFSGAYEYTPTSQTQTIDIGGMAARQDIVINPIPSNYGLITWNGSTLTVS